MLKKIYSVDDLYVFPIPFYTLHDRRNGPTQPNNLEYFRVVKSKPKYLFALVLLGWHDFWVRNCGASFV